MREKELRIALVCFGGISLAVYMHGISKEILKLVRASRALHAIADRSRRAQTRHSSTASTDASRDAEHDTEAVYFELLREIGRTLELRVIVDIIAGASAGGINGTMLARALSHDLPMEALRDLWLKNADVDVAALGRGAGAPLEQVVPAAAVLGRRGDRPVPHHHGPGGAAETVAVRALALVPAAARRARDGRPDVRRRDLDGRGEGPQARCCRPARCSTCSSR